MLRQQPLDQPQESGEAGLEIGVASNLAADVAIHPAKECLELPDHGTHALELLGMSIAPGHQGGALGHMGVASAQDHAVALGLAQQEAQGLQIQTTVGRVGDRLNRTPAIGIINLPEYILDY